MVIIYIYVNKINNIIVCHMLIIYLINILKDNLHHFEKDFIVWYLVVLLRYHYILCRYLTLKN